MGGVFCIVVRTTDRSISAVIKGRQPRQRVGTGW
jgi:hypothetical protein